MSPPTSALSSTAGESQQHKCEVCTSVFASSHGLLIHKSKKHQVKVMFLQVVANHVFEQIFGKNRSRNQKKLQAVKRRTTRQVIPWSSSSEFMEYLFFLKASCGLSKFQMENILEMMRCISISKIPVRMIPRDTRTLIEHSNGRKEVKKHVFEISVGRESREAIFHYFDPRDELAELLEMFPNSFSHDPEHVSISGRREIQDGEFWRNVQEQFETYRPGITPVPVILYTDGTQVGNFSRKTAKPIYLTTGNFSLRQRMEHSRKRVIGYMPVFENTVGLDLKSKDFKRAKRELLQATWAFVIQLMGMNDIESSLLVQGKSFFPVMTFLCLDHPEAMLTSTVMDSPRTNHPCRMCLVENQNLHILRPYVDRSGPGRRYIIEGTDFSQHPENSPFNQDTIQTLHQSRGVSWMTPPCVMHTLAQGMSKYCINYVVHIVEHNGFQKNGNVDELDNIVVDYNPEIFVEYNSDSEADMSELDNYSDGFEDLQGDTKMEVEDAEHISGDGNSDLESEDDEPTLFDENVEDDSLSATTALMNQASKNVSKKKKRAFKFTTKSQVIVVLLSLIEIFWC
jgi:hypothetical protein